MHKKINKNKICDILIIWFVTLNSLSISFQSFELIKCPILNRKNPMTN